jgi:hypothetical protein
MAQQIEIELPQTGKVQVSVTQTETCIIAKVGNLTYNGDLHLYGTDGFEARVKAAIREALSSQLPVRLTFGNITCTGSFNI